jgi:outer membrane protein OmpA-like peptidoglycan-associated protein
MRKERPRRLTILALCFVLTLAAISCKERRSPVVTPGSAAAQGTPQRIDVSLDVALPGKPDISSVQHDATRPRRPGETVRFSAQAAVPDGYTLRIEVEGTSWRLHPQPTGAAQSYAVSDPVPRDVSPGEYQVQGVLVSSDGSTAKTLAAPRPLVVAAAETPCESVKGRLAELRVHFEYDRADVNAEAKSELAAIADILKALHGTYTHAEVMGHCDARGTVQYNLSLGGKRAITVLTYLADLGVLDKTRARTNSWGKEKLLDLGTDEAAHARNRRVEIELTCGE